MKFARIALAVAAFAASLAQAADTAHGKVLYNSYCTPCHGFPPSGGPETAANNPSKIQGAINGNVPAMAFLRSVLSSADIADIAAYLGTLSTTTPPGPVVPAFNVSDLWWNPQESGWGLNLVQHASSNIFGVMYTYEAPNRPLWLVIPGGTWLSPSIFTGTIYRVSGPLASAFDSTKVIVNPVGTATLSFTDANNGTFTFTMNGTTVTKTITRQPF
jgi:cytochrome c553